MNTDWKRYDIPDEYFYLARLLKLSPGIDFRDRVHTNLHMQVGIQILMHIWTDINTMWNLESIKNED